MERTNAENPLLNDVVLHTIFGFLPHLPDLKSARLVCRVWTKASLKEWRKTGVIVLLQSRNKRRQGERHLLSVSEFVSLMQEQQGISSGFDLARRPFQRYRLKGWSFNGASGEEIMFQEELGRVVSYLHLDNCKFQTYHVLDELLTQKLPTLLKLVWSGSKFVQKKPMDEEDDDDPIYGKHVVGAVQNVSLKTVEVTRDSGELFGHDESSQIKLFYSSPNIQEFIIRATQKVTTRSLPGFWHLVSLLASVKSRRERHANANAASSTSKSRSFQLRILDVMDYYNDVVLGDGSIIEDMERPFDLGLEQLSVDVGAMTPAAEAKYILGENSRTLKILKAFRAPISHAVPPYKTIPFMESMTQLRELTLWGNFTRDLAFLQYTPVLETLVLKSDCFDKWYKLKSYFRDSSRLVKYTADLVEGTLATIRRRQGTLPEETLTLRTLKHLDIDSDISVGNIGVLAGWLPNVRTLKMVLKNNESLGAVSRAWPGLTELECLFGSKVDDDGISCLEQFLNLNKFKSNAFCNEGLLSSASADRVFLKMNSLEDLDICVSAKMSKESEEELRRRIYRVKIIRNYDDINGMSKHKYECCDRMEFLCSHLAE